MSNIWPKWGITITTVNEINSSELRRSLSYLILGKKGGKKRMEILQLLKDRPYNINQISEKMGVNYRTVKHHMDVMLKFQLINSSHTGGYGEVFFLSTDLEGDPAIFKEMTEKVEVHEKLKDFSQSEEFYESILQNTDPAVILVDKDWNVSFWNESAQRMFGLSRKDALHLPLTIFSGEGAHKDFEAAIGRKNNLSDYESTAKNTAGDMLSVSITATPIVSKSLMIGYSLLVRDITEQKRAAEALAIAEQELSRQKELALIGQMAGGVGHELYNPLASIKNAAFFLGMALKDAEPDVREAVEIMKSETAESERIIKTLLEFARTGSANRRPIDANATVRKALSRIAVPKTIRTRQTLARTLPKVKADPDQLEIVLRNVILNAVQAMPDGGKLVVGSRSSRTGSVSIYVTDTGEGIPKENLERIFDPLFTTKPKGVGLGLAVAKRLVEAHNGKISVQSGEKAGCTFTITIPIGTEEAI